MSKHWEKTSMNSERVTAKERQEEDSMQEADDSHQSRKLQPLTNEFTDPYLLSIPAPPIIYQVIPYDNHA